MPEILLPSPRCANIQRTYGAVAGSGSNRCIRRPPPCVRLIRVRASIDKPVPIRRPTTKITPLITNLSTHRRQHPMPSPKNLPLRLGTKHGHQRLVMGIVGLEGPASLREPHLHSVTLKKRQHTGKLSVAEGTLILTDHDRIETAIRIAERRQQSCGSRTPRPRQATGTSSVEELRHNDTVPGDGVLCRLPLPGSRGHAVLVAACGSTTIESEPNPATVTTGRTPRRSATGVLDPGAKHILTVLEMCSRHADHFPPMRPSPGRRDEQ